MRFAKKGRGDAISDMADSSRLPAQAVVSCRNALGVPPGRHRCYNYGARMSGLEYELALIKSVTNPLE